MGIDLWVPLWRSRLWCCLYETGILLFGSVWRLFRFCLYWIVFLCDILMDEKKLCDQIWGKAEYPRKVSMKVWSGEERWGRLIPCGIHSQEEILIWFDCECIYACIYFREVILEQTDVKARLYNYYMYFKDWWTYKGCAKLTELNKIEGNNHRFVLSFFSSCETVKT